ncbi:aminoglycoside phosphotransferase family protein [Planktotalea sp.]|uniref:aminoglycoside phosphotransferase family protein n=1 Tax=Planktotalea sp. TaxID=2029877 RepID=UPI0032993A08
MTIQINTSLVRRLIDAQFPEYTHLPIRAVPEQGNDNRTFRLGDQHSIRLPSNSSYASAVAKEATALKSIKPVFSLDVPDVVAMGQPSEDYPLPWSIRRWIDGVTWQTTEVKDKRALAKSLGGILKELRAIPTLPTLFAGQHSFYRGCHPSAYSDEVIKSLGILNDTELTQQCLRIWQRGLTTVWTHDPVWFHGDIAVGNVLMNEQNITALIDFGTCGVGDPACDYAIAWTYFDAETRAHFREAIEIDDGTWQRAKAWALWKALVSLTGLSAPDTHGIQKRALKEICDEGVSID